MGQKLLEHVSKSKIPYSTQTILHLRLFNDDSIDLNDFENWLYKTKFIAGSAWLTEYLLEQAAKQHEKDENIKNITNKK